MLAFIYRQVGLESGLIEHEYDHTFTGRYDGAVSPNSEEADAYRWMAPADLMRDMEQTPERYTVWSRIAFAKLTRSTSSSAASLPMRAAASRR